MEPSMGRKLAAEALGTLILVGVVVGSGIMADRLTEDVALALWANAAATGAILAVLILIFGPISGAHFNPAVTLYFAVRRNIGWAAAAAFVAAQIIGGLGGTVLAHAMFEQTPIQASITIRAGGAQLLSEGVATFALLAAIAGCVRFRPEAVPYAVALVITAGYWWTASTSFANPAVAIARTITDTFAGIRPADAPAFVIVQLLAAGLCAAIFPWLFGDPEAG